LIQAILFSLFLPVLCFAVDFEEAMGKGGAAWQYVQTPEDHGRLEKFKQRYQEAASALDHPSVMARIPKVLHFIWLGPRDFPIASIEKVEKWIELHPDWTVKFWTDINRAPPLKKMQKQLVEDFTFQILGDGYYNSDNFGEKARILCYEILFQEGGLYVDHDVKPCIALDSFHHALDFYCGLEKLGPSLLSTSIYAASHLLAARPAHPILLQTLYWLKKNWKQLDEFYPGQSKAAIRNRFFHRTLWALSAGIDGYWQEAQPSSCDLIFPAAFFSQAKRHPSTLALHMHEETWTVEENDFEANMRGQFQELLVKNHESLKIVLLLALGALLSVIILFAFARTMRKSYEA
jgi:hypothetical protein